MILIVDDDRAVLESISFLLKKNGFNTCMATNTEEAWQQIEQEEISLIILDMNFTIETTGEDGLRMLRELKQLHPSIPVILITGWGHMALAIEGMKAGAADFINKPWENSHLLQSVHTALELHETDEDATSHDRKVLDDKYNFEKIIGNDRALLDVLKIVGKVSKTNATVLISGESGTGKELIAEAIHENSLRVEQPFVKVNLGGVQQNLFESEMFGHVKGAFTDAYFDRKGRFELANNGSIFLDELGELDPASQVKLLRVLQERKFEVLGSSETRSVDVRVICATNKNLEKMVEQGEFREDLFYRINLVKIFLPPLRNRKEDIPLLTTHFLTNLKLIYNRPQLNITTEALNWLKELPFPGNIRELKNLVERTILLNDRDTLRIENFKNQLEKVPQTSTATHFPAVGEMSLEEMEIKMIQKAMEFHQNKISEVAKSLGISRNALYRRLEKYNIENET